MYMLISRSNELLLYIDNEATTGWESAELQAMYKGEVLFFRAYAYRLLASFYGDIPLVTEAVSTPKTDFVRTPLKEVYAQDVYKRQVCIPIGSKTAWYLTTTVWLIY